MCLNANITFGICVLVNFYYISLETISLIMALEFETSLILLELAIWH